MARPTRSGREKEESSAILLCPCCMLSGSTKLCIQRNLASVHTRDSCLSTMMCTPLHSQSGLWRSTGFWGRSCGSTAASGSMPAKPRSGTGVAMSPVGTKPSSTKLEPSILTQKSCFVVLIVLRKNVASEFWALHLVQRVCQVAVGCHRGSSPVVASADPSSAGLAVSVASFVVLRFIATFYLRVCHPDNSEDFARQHDVHTWQCLHVVGATARRSPTGLGQFSLPLGGTRLA